MGLKQLLETTRQQSSELEMSNEAIVAEIQMLDDTTDPKGRQRLSDLQAKLFSQNAGLVVKVAAEYNRGKTFTQDETDELAVAVFVAARKFDPERGVNFSACLPFYVCSALQREHAFTSGHSQSVYARARAKLNNIDRYDRDEVAKAEALLRSKKPFSEETVSDSTNENMSAEDLFLSLTDRLLDEEKKEWMLTLAREAIETLTDRQRAVLGTMLDPLRATNEYGLRTNEAIGKNLHIERLSVEVERQHIFTQIQDYIFENEPSLRPAGWTNEQKGIQLPGMEGFLLGLFSAPTVEEVANYRARTSMGRRR